MWRAFTATVAVLVAIAFVLAINAIVVDAETRGAVARDSGHLVDTGVVRANIRIDGGGPPIVLIHGFGAALDWWDKITPALARQYRVIRLDLIGHGGTEAPASGYSIERQATLVQAVLDKNDVARAIVIGHSMGGAVATAFAAANPSRVDRLVLIDTPPKPETAFDLNTRLGLAPIVGQFLWHMRTNAVLRQALSQGFAPGFPVPEAFVRDLKQLTYTAFRTAHRDSIAYVTQAGTPARLAELDPVPPLLVIFGTRDALIAPSSAKLYETVRGAKIVMIDGAGHSPMVEKPEETLAVLKTFLGDAGD
jgi:pimeloyl-ACP methyl ester carboxylesterase